MSQFVGRSCSVVGRIPVAVVERYEDLSFCDFADLDGHLDHASTGPDHDVLSVLDLGCSGIFGGDFNERCRAGGLQVLRSSGLGPGVEVVHLSTGRQLQWKLFVRRVERGNVIGSFEDRSSSGIQLSVLIDGQGRAGLEVVSVAFAIINVRKEDAVVEQSFFSVRIRFRTRPLDAGATGELLVAHFAVVAWSAFGKFLPCIEGVLRVGPRNERTPVFVFEVHPLRILDKDFKVRFGLAGWIDGLV